MKAFNFPYQLGYDEHNDHGGGGDGDVKSFQHPSECDSGVVPVAAGDIVILATDG